MLSLLTKKVPNMTIFKTKIELLIDKTSTTHKVDSNEEDCFLLSVKMPLFSNKMFLKRGLMLRLWKLKSKTMKRLTHKMKLNVNNLLNHKFRKEESWRLKKKNQFQQLLSKLISNVKKIVRRLRLIGMKKNHRLI